MSEAKIQSYKIDAVAELKAEVEVANDYFFTDYRGITVEQITNLRRQLRKENTSFRVVKNRFAKIVFKDLKKPAVDEYLKGPTAVAIVKGESGPAAKILFDFAKENPIILKGGIVENAVFDAKKVEAYAQLPSKKQLLAQLMGTINATTSKFVRTLQAVADKKQEAGE